MERKIEIGFLLDDIQFSQQLDAALINQPTFEILIIINILTASKALQLVSQKWFQSLISNQEHLVAIILSINEAFNDDLPANLDLIFKPSILIAFQSTIGERGSKTYWKTAGRDKFYTLGINDDPTDDVTSFCHEFLVDEIKSNRSGILENFQLKDKIRLQEIGDSNGRNLLALATSKTQQNVVKNLLNHDFDSDDVIDVAWDLFLGIEDDNEKKQEANEIILSLLSANSKFPDDFEYEKASKEVKEFVDKCESLHEDVDEDNFDALKLKLESDPNLIHFYSRDSESLLAYSLRMRKFKIFDLLDKGITVGSHEDLDEVYENMYVLECLKLQEQHKINAKEFPETHIFILRSKSRIGNNDKLSHKNWKFIDEAFEMLNKNGFIRKILKVAAEFKKLKIYFDFKHDSTYYLDPATSIYSKGIIYEGGSIFIGAKHLIDDERKFAVFGVLAHELCHLAVFMAFMNRNFDPFPVGESVIGTRFKEQVMVQCKEREEAEEIVANVFSSYAKDVQDSEMIVTVPQMLMHYVNDSAKIEELEGTFEDLFKYCREVVDPELDKALPVLKQLGDDEKVIKFADLTVPMKAKVLHSKLNFQGSETTFNDLIGDDQDVFNLLSSGNIRRLLIKNGKLEYSSICELNLKYGMIERKFIESNVDERLKLMDLNAYVEEAKKYTKGLEAAEVFLLADYAGTGKTTSFKDSAIKLKELNKNFWISYINLRSHGSTFEKFKDKAKELKFDDICEILLEIVDQESEVEEEIFTKLFSTGKTMLLFDGFDEVSPRYTEIILKILELLTTNEVKNHVWISTRPHYSNKLVDLLKVPVHKFVGTTHFERVDMINRILDAHKVTEQLRILQNVNMYIYGFFTTDRNTYNTLIDNPLMIQMITELFIDNSIQIDDINICRLYLKMIDKQKEKVGIKIPNSERDPTGKLSVWDVHRVLAIILVFGDDFEDQLGFKIEELGIMKKWKKEKKNWTSDMIQRYGFVIVDLNAVDLRNSIDFVHRTYAEFFIAQFLMDFVFDDNEEVSEVEVKRKFSILDLIMIENAAFKVIFDFMLKYFEVYPENKLFDDTVHDMILLEIDKIHAANSEDLFTKFSNYAKFIKHNQELTSKLWLLNQSKNIFQKLIQKNYKNYSKMTKTAEFCFESNWHQKFSKNDTKLVADEALNAIDGMSYNEFVLNSDKNSLKFYDLVMKTFEEEEKEMFLENFDINEVWAVGAQIEIIFKINESSQIMQKYLNDLNYSQISVDNFNRLLCQIENILNNDQNLIRNFLFKNEELTIFKDFASENQEIITVLNRFVAKYGENESDGVCPAKKMKFN
ncbi:unnamed protein product [Chironomus riparius]|uniref:NACHT domain-containing protein n=1 Tax=Chironomus riparius TaxID=315576 RepID=A0A9P0J9R0_9DIPT|nr:unnamed protein product [Chironomus riparius]